MADTNTTWKQVVYDTADAYRTASATTANVKVGELAQKISTLEDVTAEVTTQTPLIEDIKESLVGKATGANATEDTILEGYSAYVGQELVEGKYKPHGLYVWKKYEYGALQLTNPSITLVQDDSSFTGNFWYNITGISDDIKNAIDVSFFEGFSNGTVKMQVGTGNELKLVEISTESVLDGVLEWLPETKQIYSDGNLGFSPSVGANLNYSYEGKKAISGLQGVGDFVDYVVSDTETEYPDGGAQDGYWYEKNKDILTAEKLGYTKIAVDTFTLTSNASGTKTVSHSLGDLPKFLFLLSDDTTDGYIRVYFCSYYGNEAMNIKYYNKNGNVVIYDASSISNPTWNSTQLQIFATASTKLRAGQEYTLITMA